ncbi:hypothetical protein AVEN_20181-1 [Araneus ventricosus]|uniref:Uncharacterized protein n=1 Tax=Araneus ventricosus TaxID=182803 RepID=A0A4Y2CLC4_ARAVE|nr:hypothetical protein AVEN_20181-1 [Araneus ventricosus]
MNFGDIAKRHLTYLQIHYGSNVAVVFDGYPSDVNGKSTKSAERIRRANLHSSHEIIFNEATCPEISQEQFLANERNKYDNIFVVGEDIDFLALACGCRKAGLICSSLCTCSLGEACENVSDINLLEGSIEDEDDSPSSINNFIYEDIEDLNLQLDEEDTEQQTELEDFRPGPSKRQNL